MEGKRQTGPLYPATPEAKQHPFDFLSCEPVNISNVFLLRLSELGACHQKNFDRNHI